MSAPGSECVVCGRDALDLSGWDGGFPSYREFRAVWDPPRVFQDMVHFACLRDWKHLEGMLAELVDLAIDAVLEFDVEVGGQIRRVTRSGLGYAVRLLETEDLLVLWRAFGADWLIVDRAGAWQFIGRSELRGLVRGEAVYANGGRGRYGLSLTPAPSEAQVNSWVLSDMLRHLQVEDRYSGLLESEANLRIERYDAGTGHLEYIVEHPLTIHPEALGYFRGEFERMGDSAVAPIDG
jgi:hypothetical protein